MGDEQVGRRDRAAIRLCRHIDSFLMVYGVPSAFLQGMGDAVQLFFIKRHASSVVK
jgi:hypothetical protein